MPQRMVYRVFLNAIAGLAIRQSGESSRRDSLAMIPLEDDPILQLDVARAVLLTRRAGGDITTNDTY